MADVVVEMKEKKEKRSFYSVPVSGISGSAVDLSLYKGKVLMIVNTASECGYTSQYNDLELVYKKYAKEGFVILGFPSNDFGAQEPGTNEDIKAFCDIKTGKYKISFPMMAKVNVKSSPKHTLYKFLTEESHNEFRGDVTWNFEKFLINKSGVVVGRFKPSTKPQDPEVTKKIEKALAEKSP